MSYSNTFNFSSGVTELDVVIVPNLDLSPALSSSEWVTSVANKLGGWIFSNSDFITLVSSARLTSDVTSEATELDEGMFTKLDSVIWILSPDAAITLENNTD